MHASGPKAVILARGLGTRMRRPDTTVALDQAQAAMAEAGVKALMPVGRPFLDYVLGALADAGFREACLVIGPEHEAVRQRYTTHVASKRLRIAFALQERALGTADAVLAAEAFTAGEPFLALNGDNYYPPDVCATVWQLDGPGLAAFRRDALLHASNIPADRIGSYALLQVGANGFLERIVEKPGIEAVEQAGPGALVSMNIWRLTPIIFEACRAIRPSPRGELELPIAIQHAIDALGVRFRTVTLDAPVLDLSTRADVAGVAARLQGTVVDL